MNLRHVIVIAMVVLLTGCASASDPEPSPTSSVGASASATPEAGASPSPTVAFPVPMSITQDLTAGGAKQIVRRMMEITSNRPALKLDVSASEVKEHPTSSTTIAMAMARRRLTDPAYFGRWFRP